MQAYAAMMQSASADPRKPTSLNKLLRQTQQDPSGCLLWTGGVCAAGQPIFKNGNKSLRVAREVYLAVHGAPKKKHWVVEARCSNLRCIAPDHLAQVPHSQATRRLVGVPLPKGESIKSAGYVLVHRVRGASIWEPKDIAKAVWQAQGLKSCVVCGVYLDRRGKFICSASCDSKRDMAKARIAQGRPKPGDEAKASTPRHGP